MTYLRRLPLLAAAAGLLLAVTTACASETSSAETSDIFEAAPWPSGESLQYQVVNAEGDRLGTGTLESMADAGVIALHQRYVEAETPAGAEQVRDDITVWVNASTFRPERGERIAVGRDDDGNVTTDRWEWTYGVEDGETVITVVHDDGEGEPEEHTLRLRDHYYDNESSLWLWRSVDLSEEHEAFYVSVNALERSQQTVNLRVPQTEVVTVPAGEFEAYRLLFRNGRAVRTAWIEAAEPHRVLRWDNGSSILELLP
ncbi:MAG: DUF3108 domain-containing protein [Dehalococcoidia bacterium]